MVNVNATDGLKLPNKAVSPTAGTGIVYFDTGTSKLKICEDGTNFTSMDSSRIGSTLNYNFISVGAAATLIKATNSNRVGILIKNNGSQTIYIGKDGSVTTSTGYPLLAGQSIYIIDKGAVYGIVASSTCESRYLEAQ